MFKIAVELLTTPAVSSFIIMSMLALLIGIFIKLVSYNLYRLSGDSERESKRKAKRNAYIFDMATTFSDIYKKDKGLA